MLEYDHNIRISAENILEILQNKKDKKNDKTKIKLNTQKSENI